MSIKSTFKFPVVVSGKTYPKAEEAWVIGQPLPVKKEGVIYLVNAVNFLAHKESRKDLCMLDPQTKNVIKDGSKFGKTTYGGFLFS